MKVSVWCRGDGLIRRSCWLCVCVWSCGTAGVAGDADMLIRLLQSNMQLFTLDTGRQPHCTQVCRAARQILHRSLSHSVTHCLCVCARVCVSLSTLLPFVFDNSVLCVLGWCWLLLKDVPKTVHFLHSIFMQTKMNDFSPLSCWEERIRARFTYSFYAFVTSAKEVMFSSLFVCLSVCC